MLQALEAREAPAELALRASLLARLIARRRWLVGTALSLAGAGLQVLALAYAPVTLVQPVLALGLVGLVVLARVRLDERVGATGAAGVACVIAGVAAVAVASPEESGHVTSVTALVVLLVPIALITVLPFALRARAPVWLAVGAAAGGDVLAAIALKLTADAASTGRLVWAAVAVAGAAATGGLALTAEMSALRTVPATRVAPVVLSAQVIVPAVTAVLAFGEPASPLLVLGVCAAGVGAGLLGGSHVIARMGAGDGPLEPEAVADDARSGGQRPEGVAG